MVLCGAAAVTRVLPDPEGESGPTYKPRQHPLQRDRKGGEKGEGRKALQKNEQGSGGDGAGGRGKGEGWPSSKPPAVDAVALAHHPQRGKRICRSQHRGQRRREGRGGNTQPEGPLLEETAGLQRRDSRYQAAASLPAGHEWEYIRKRREGGRQVHFCHAPTGDHQEEMPG